MGHPTTPVDVVLAVIDEMERVAGQVAHETLTPGQQLGDHPAWHLVPLAEQLGDAILFVHSQVSFCSRRSCMLRLIAVL